MIVNKTRMMVVESVAVADVYNLTVDMQSVQLTEQIEVVGALDFADVAASLRGVRGPDAGRTKGPR